MSGSVYDTAYISIDVTKFRKVTYTITCNNTNASGGNALVIDRAVKAYTKAFNESTLTSNGTLDISEATTLEVRTYANGATLNTGFGGTYVLEFT